ncbi:hypothetical protein [Bacillus sp. M6-12]|uniref:hypothetical protein n=1 Tax=Bacillus sp. M6-12 TaxID=2054166 RepID=UPI0015E06073|nr:hypothetical protein [Bacillus sp. M6-12]
MIKTIEELKRSIEREMDLVPENGVTDEHGNWTSQKNEEKRLRNLHADICYFMREYS